MGKKKTTDQRILLMTDSASDISDADLLEGGIVMLPIPIAIDGKGYLERVDFTTREFYERLTAAKELPVTSHILSITYQQAYLDARKRLICRLASWTCHTSSTAHATVTNAQI